MKSPITGKEMSLRRKKSSLTFRKEEFIFFSHFYVCEDSGEQFTSTELDELNVLQVHNQYRDKYNLPFPSEIQSIRNKYELAATKMSEILGFGINSYRNYENGEVPSNSNGKLIQLVNDPKKFRDMVDLCDTLDPKEKLDIINRVDNIILNLKKNSFSLKMEDYLLGSKLPDSISGYVKPDFTKLTEMVKFFSESLNPWKTVLNKLLFYSDFLAYRNNCFSMSGVRYRAIKMGPVPNNYNSIYEFMFNREDIEINNVAFTDNIFGYRFNKTENKEFNAEIFSSEEIEILNLVCSKFSGMTTNDVIKFSHQEKAWLENNEERKLIDYTYAFDIVQI
jgi:Predicted transcriptional regulator